MRNRRDDELEDGSNDPHHEKNRDMPRLTRDKVKALHDAGLNDSEIGAALGVSSVGVTVMREVLGLSPHPRSAHEAGRDRLARFRAMYAMGCEDTNIASALHITPAKVAAMRGEWELEQNRPPPTTDYCLKHYSRGRSDAEIAAATGLTPAEVAHWRERYNLSAHADGNS